MTTKIKILIGILAIGVILIGVFWTWEEYVAFKPYIPSPLTPISKEVTITTDKTEYEQGETVKIRVKNYLDRLIWYNKETCPPFCVQLQKLENGEWISVSMAIPVVVDLPVRASSLQPYEEIVREWDMFIVKPVDQIITAESGKYRFSFSYGLNAKNHTKETIYSPEFTIKEKEGSIPQAVLQYCDCDSLFLCGGAVFKCSNDVFEIIPAVTDIGVHYIDRNGKILAENCGGYGEKETSPECTQFYGKDFRCENINLCKQ